MSRSSITLIFVWSVLYYKNVCICFNLNVKYAQTLSLNENFENYFGFSVLLQNGLNPSVVVGSPKSNYSYGAHRNESEPGSVYRCLLENSKCTQYGINNQDGKINYNNGVAFHQILDGAFVGSTLDGGTNSQSLLITCGPRWINVQSNGEYYLDQGICYLLKNSSDYTAQWEKMMPLINNQKQSYKNTNNEEFYYYAMGGAGWALNYIESSGEILLGAPGVINWRGTCILYNKDDRFDLPASRRKRTTDIPDGYNVFQSVGHIPNPIFNSRLQQNNDSYLGYAVSYGKFKRNSNAIWYVSGAPRGEMLKGQVFLFEMPNVDDSDLKLHMELNGEQYGSYFGSSLLVLDLNNDGADDLLVGAPMYSRKFYDEGCVYVYINDGQGSLTKAQTIYPSSEAINARFGSAMSAVDDINGDNYPDVVISAPYEQNGKGAIYVYLGTENGLRNTHSQKIKAESVNENIQRFGYSLSKGVDVDLNQYNDLAIGAYKSGHVVVLKSQPVVKFVVTFKPNYLQIPIDVNKFSVQYCVNVTSKRKFSDFDASLDRWTSNGFFKVDFGRIDVKMTNKVPFHCSQLDIFISNSTDRGLKFEISIGHVIKNTDCIECPIIDPTDNKVTSVQIPFANGCEHDTCNYDLHLYAEFDLPKNELIIGTKNTLAIDTKIINKAEPSFLTMLKVLVPHEIDILRTPSLCQYKNPYLECNIGNPLLRNKTVTLKIEFDLRKLTGAVKQLDFEISASGSGIDVNEVDNTKTLHLNLLSESEINIVGKSDPYQLVYKDEQNESLRKRLKFSHEFSVQNYGPSPAEQLTIDFFLPRNISRINGNRKETFVEVYKPTAYVDGHSIECATDNWNGFDVATVKGQSTDLLKSTNSVEIRLKRESDRARMEKMSTFAALSDDSSVSELPVNRTLYLNCSSDELQVDCMHVRCHSGQLKNLNQLIFVKFSFQAEFKIIDQYLNQKDIVLYTSKAIVQLNEKSTERYTHTIMLGKLSDQTVSAWVIILAIFLGILLIAIIVAVLWKILMKISQGDLESLVTDSLQIFYKMGFFKRKMKEEMLLQAQDNTKLESINTAADVNDEQEEEQEVDN